MAEETEVSMYRHTMLTYSPPLMYAFLPETYIMEVFVKKTERGEVISTVKTRE